MKYYEKSASKAIISGLQAGEFAITWDPAGHEILAVAIAREDRKGSLINFAAAVSGKVNIEDSAFLETGFYPVKRGGKTRLAFIVYGEVRFVPSAYVREIRLSGGLIDLDKEVYMRDMRKASDHLAAENRKLLKEVKDFRKAFEEEREERKLHENIKSFDPSESARQKRREEVQVNCALGKDKDDDDEDLYI